MEVVSLSPLRVGSILWQPRVGAVRLTVVCKATFDIVAGESRLADSQEDLNEDDNHWNDDAERSLFSPSDMVPFKMRADVLVVGHAFAPRGEAVHSLVARAAVAEMDKSIEVFGARGFKDGVIEEPTPFARMPLRYERAAGGPESMNPVGVPSDAPADSNGVVPVASIVAPGAVAHLGGLLEPIGLGPIAPSWPLRRAQLGRHAATWDKSAWNTQPMPEDIELGYFNAAPRDQQVEAIRDNERIVLDNLHPEHAHLVTRLPGVHPRAFFERQGRAPEDVVMRGDTLWIDTDRGICTLTWRGQIALDSPLEVGRVLVALEDGRQRLGFADVERLAQHAPPKATRPVEVPRALAAAAKERRPSEPPKAKPLSQPPPALDLGASGATKQGLGAFEGAAAEARARAADAAAAKGPAAKFMATPAPPLAPGGGSLSTRPRRASGAPPPLPPSVGDSPNAASVRVDVGPPPRVPRLVDEPSHATMDMSMAGLAHPGLTNALPFAPPAPAESLPFAPTNPGGPRLRRTLDDATATEEPPNTHGMPAWLAQSPTSSRRPRVDSVPPPPIAAAPPIATPSSPPPAPAAEPARAAAPEDPSRGKRSRATTLASRGADIVDLSSTASIETDAPPTIELIHVDVSVGARLRQMGAFASLVEGFGEDEAEGAGSAAEVRRHVFAVLTRGAPGDVAAIGEVLARGVAPDGSFVPPLVLVGGELELGFSDVEVLRATIAALTPLFPIDPAAAAAERALVEAVSVAEIWLSRQGADGPSSVAEALTARIRDVVARGTRLVPAGYVEAHTERIALERRAYQTRAVLGDRWIRGRIVSPATGASVPTYVPIAAAGSLPLFRQFSARALVEVHPRQDQFEGHPACLRVVGLARRLGPSASRSGS